MSDPFQSAENLEEQTLGYARDQTKRFRERYGHPNEEVLSKVAEYAEAKRVFQTIVSGDNLAVLYSKGKEYFVSLNDEIVYSTEKVISWINLSKEFHRLAIFETSGSDLGTLKIMDRGEAVQVTNDNVKQAVFTDGSFYMVKTYSKENPPDGGELNSHRVLLDGKIVFGTGLKSEEFIDLYKSKDRAIITVGDWNHSSIYTGLFEDPSTWARIVDLNSPVIPIGIVDNEVCYLEKSGNGFIKKGSRILIESAFPIESCVLVNEGFLVLSLVDAKISPMLYDFSGKILKKFELEVPMGLVSIDSDESSAAMVLESFGIPYSLYSYRSSGLSRIDECKLMKLDVQERFLESNGVKIHSFFVKPVDPVAKKALVYGYGGFNISLSPKYSPLFATLLHNGVMIVQTNLRGGGEYGEAWHLAGVREKKQNVFDDFISVISALKAEHYKVVEMGESNGGLLTGAILTQKPEIIDGAVIGVPVLDMLRFHLMSVGKYWVSEYGNPDDLHDAEFLSQYSPYHNIREQHFPPVLIWSRLKDDRVHPAHAIKFHMRLNPLCDEAFLRLDETGGHQGIAIKDHISEICESFNFIMECLD